MSRPSKPEPLADVVTGLILWAVIFTIIGAVLAHERGAL